MDTLSERFAQDQLTLDRFERLVEAAQKAQSAADLAALLEDGRPGAPAGAERGAPPVPATAQAPAPADSPWSAPAKEQAAVAVFGEARREGYWTPPAAAAKAVAVVGSVVLDYRDARVAQGDLAVFAVTFLGSVEIVVPPGWNVECNVSAVFGSVDRRAPFAATAPDAAAPTLHVRGVAVFGSVEIHHRHSGETKRDAKRRLRQEKRERKRLAKRGRKL